MTARSVPPEREARDGFRGEYDVWQRLRRSLPDGTVLLCGVKVPTERDPREIDLLVLWPDVGIAVVEVKGGAVGCEDGQWRSSRNGKSKDIDSPMEQAESARHALSRYLREAGVEGARARIQHLVVLPHQDLPDGFDPTACPRAQVVDRGELDDLVVRIAELVQDGAGHRPLASEHVAAVERLFFQQLHPDDAADATEQEQRAEQLAVQQVDVLDLLGRQPAFTVIGGAGTGKTGLALEQARRLAASGKRVALLCYSRGLGQLLARTAATWKHAPAFAGTFEAFALESGAPTGVGDDHFARLLPEALAALAEGQPPRFDAVVVDEAQDFYDSWWRAVLAWTAPGDPAPLFAFLDEGQRVFERRAPAPLAGQPYPLQRNYRNTKRIAQTFGSLAQEQPRFGGLEGAHVRYVACSTDDVMDRADDAVNALLDSWEPGQVALLTTAGRHNVQKTQTEHGDEGYWTDFFAEDDVFYGTVSGFKGLERTCVVLAVNGWQGIAREAETLYVGLSRARSQLVVVGDLDVIAPADRRGGVRQRLERAQRWQPLPS